VACALVDVRAGGPGRVVDAAIVDIVAMLGMIAQWVRGRGEIDTGQPSPFHDSPHYDVYECADGRYVSIGALEPQFYDLLLTKLGLDELDRGRQGERADWPALKERIATTFRSHPQQHWCELLEGTDACFAPVLTIAEAVAHPHNVARGLFRQQPDGSIAPAVAPRFL